MKILLLEDVDNLGAEGEVVSVKPGYGRNYLIPKGLARLATAGVMQAWKEERRQKSRKLSKYKEDAEALAAELAKVEVVIQAKVGEENRIFGTVTAPQIALALAAKGVEVDRRKVDLAEDIRVLGVYTATVKLHPEVIATIKVRVEPEDDAVEA